MSQTKPLSAGKRVLQFFRIKKNTGNTAYEIRKADGTTLATAVSDATLTIGLLEDLTWDIQDSGSWQFNIAHYQTDEDMAAFLKQYAWRKGGGASGASGLPEITWIDGDKYGAAAAASGEEFLIMGYGPVDTDNSDKRMIPVAIVTIAPTSGGKSLNGTAHIKPKLTLNSVAAAFELTIPMALFDTGATVVTANQTLDQNLFGDELWVPSHA